MGSFIWKGTAILGSKCGGNMGTLGEQKFIPQVLPRDQRGQRVLLGCLTFLTSQAGDGCSLEMQETPAPLHWRSLPHREDLHGGITFRVKSAPTTQPAVVRQHPPTPLADRPHPPTQQLDGEEDMVCSPPGCPGTDLPLLRWEGWREQTLCR